MSIELITGFLFLSLFILIFLGLPLAFVLGSVSIVFSYFLWGPESIYLVASRTSGTLFSFIMLAVPLFMFMANMLERSGIAEDLYAAMHVWMGPIRGGLAAGTVCICTLFAAMSGVSAAAVLTMGLIAVPAMLKRHYDQDIVLGSVVAGGALGQLIPPSVLMVIYGSIAGVSVGKLFMGGIFPGLMLAVLFISYILLRSFIQKDLCPSLPAKERAEITFKEKLVTLRHVILPGLLVISVLGSMFAGIATPSEAAGVGAFGSIVCAIILRRFTWKKLKVACQKTLTSSAMVMWIMIGSNMFVSVYFAVGGANFVQNNLTGLDVNPWIILFGMQFTIFMLGCVMDPTGILLLCTPLFVPIITELGFNPLWYGVLVIVNLEMAYITPPFGYNLFYLKSVVPENVSMGQIYRSVWPFVILQAVGLILCMLFPKIILYLPLHTIK